ncbi:hypothetical protein TRICI_001738 [Trichomonascus ciferrii]|uniref:D-isomer specific 2-hydroxyacid dehydrogenase NAD-binding domain-containing protein n=1 Tax=Trichomonascus ciferrii TaxID=44093 RepID=A0A642V930_9ASCO|nr:hypothetical protein TRICI_001738 [Trichomonascus ciferrii]
MYIITSKEQLIKDLKEKYNDISAIYGRYYIFGDLGGMRGDLVDALPPTLKVITVTTVGYDQFDLVALKKRGIVVCNTPGNASISVAEIALYLTLSTFRFTSVFEKYFRQTENSELCRQAITELDNSSGKLLIDPADAPSAFADGERVGKKYAHSPYGFRAGIAGFGGIGIEIGRRLNALGMEIHYFDRYKLTLEREANLGYNVTYHESFVSLLGQSDVLVLALPLHDDTKEIVNKKAIEMLPDDARIVNVGRGGLINHQHLVAALESGKLSSVGLDVHPNEPYIEKKLVERDDITLLPHLGGGTVEVVRNAAIKSINNIRDVLEGSGRGITPVN